VSVSWFSSRGSEMAYVTLFDFCDSLGFAMIYLDLGKTQRARYLSGLFQLE
jgi:hypothetical protein